MENLNRILIVGAGPTGLTLANCLAAYGVPFDIVDGKDGPSRESKALAVNILSQYQLALIGRGTAIGAGGCRVERINIYWQGARLNATDFRRLDFPLRSFVTQPQAETERELVAALPVPAAIAWGTKLTAVTEDDDGVITTVASSSGVKRRARYAYVVGCDGKNSIVRGAIGATWDGWDYPMHFLLGDFQLGWDRAETHAYYYVFEETFLVMVPIGGGQWRVVVKRDGAFDPARRIEAKDITDTAERLLEQRIFKQAPTWLSGAPFYMRIATALQSKRLFICGDAAHLFSPIGGTGMNTGMQDAFNLAWKLAYVQRESSNPSALLPSYSQERAPAIRQAAAAADVATKLIARIDKSAERIARLVPSLRSRRTLRDEMPAGQAGIQFQYGASDAIASSPGSSLARSGTLCRGLLDLHRATSLKSGEVLNTFVVLFLSRESHVESADAVRTLLDALERYANRPVSVRVVLSESIPGATEAPYMVIRDSTIAKRLGGTDRALIAVRPDGIVAFAGELADAGSLLAMLDAWFLATPVANLVAS